MTLTPAYGRDYNSKNAVLTDFLDDKDFILNDMSSKWDGKPINRPQITENEVRVRYKNSTRVVVLRRDGDTWKAV